MTSETTTCEISVENSRKPKMVDYADLTILNIVVRLIIVLVK